MADKMGNSKLNNKKKNVSGKTVRKTVKKSGTGGKKTSPKPRKKTAVTRKDYSKSVRKSAAEKKKAAAEFDEKAGVKTPAKSNVKKTKTDEKSKTAPKKKNVRQKKEGKRIVNEQENQNVKAENSSDTNADVSWGQQTSSILFWIGALFMLAFIVFEGDHLWTVIHNFIFGIFGNMAILWNGLLVYAGCMFAKQKGTLKIFEVVRSAAVLIILIDVFCYILIQSNGYRNTQNELVYGMFELIGQIYEDGSKLGGTGIIGGLIGELLLVAVGKPCALITISIIALAFSMLLAHTSPVMIFNSIKNGIIHLAESITYSKRQNTVPESDTLYGDPEFDEIEYTTEPDIYEDEPFVSIQDEPEDKHKGVNKFKSAFKLKVKNKENVGKDIAEEPTIDEDIEDENIPGEAAEEKAAEPLQEKSDDINENIDELINKAASKKRKKTKAEEIQEQKDEFTKQVNSAESSESVESEYKYPTLRLLIPSKNTNETNDKQELKATADMLINTLDEYGVKASISDISRGPTVTRYEVKPAPGVKINKITNLSNDIALRLAAQSIRIEAPIPGKPAVGIEIPNQNKQMVRIREIIGSKQFAEAKGALTVALGKDIEGNIVLCDLSKMPHLLIAGSTGSGKSVCVNSMLISLLYKYSPKEVRMVLIDPKSVEFDMYNGIPHLLVPVVCEPKKAAGALQWAVSEMLKRYGMLKEHSARNIDNYNKIAEETGEFEKLCRIVIVIDEMADLMIASPKEVEDAIARLAAMARAAGMYMVLATQRPSVDVITGTIKNNIPSRIALMVSSQIDSRTILDEGGAENLIGYGDMLYHPMGTSKHLRVQGCFVDDAEVERVIKFVKQNGSAEYDDDIADEIERNSMGAAEESADFSDKDDLFVKAVEIVTEAGQASTSMLQRRLSVGYARAGRLIDQLEENGIIGPYEGSKPRKVLITHAQWLEMTMNKTHAGKNDPIVRSHSEFAAQTLTNDHDEITARQSEFFNAQEEEEENPCDNEEESTVSNAEEESETIDFDNNSEDSEDDEEAEESEQSDEEDDESEVNYEAEIRYFPSRYFSEDLENNEGAEESEQVDEEDNESANDSEAEARDFSKFFDDDNSEQSEDDEEAEASEQSEEEDNESAGDSEAETRDFSEFFDDDNSEQSEDDEEAEESEQSDDGEILFSTDEPEDSTEKSSEPTNVKARDFSIFFDDEPESDIDILFSTDEITNSNDHQENTDSDIPPWEEEPVGEEKNEEKADDENSEEDDDYDDILSAPWIRKLK